MRKEGLENVTFTKQDKQRKAVSKLPDRIIGNGTREKGIVKE